MSRRVAISEGAFVHLRGRLFRVDQVIESCDVVYVEWYTAGGWSGMTARARLSALEDAVRQEGRVTLALADVGLQQPPVRRARPDRRTQR